MIYLDNAATTFPKPKSVRRAVQTAMRKYGANPGRSGHDMAAVTAERIFACRRRAAALFGLPAEELVIFTSNCTSALNFAIKGLVRKGDHIVTSDLEHNAVLRPLEKLRLDGVITYSKAKVIPGDFAATLESFRALFQPNTSLVVCAHASNVFGAVLPVHQLAKLAHDRGAKIVVDAAQSAGILDIHLARGCLDCVCVPGHKGLYGPSGTGMLLLRTDTFDMDTVLEGGTGSLSALLLQPELLPDKFESGTINTNGIIGLAEGIRTVRQIGLQAIRDHEYELMHVAFDGFSSIKNVRLYTEKPEYPGFVPLISFNVSGFSSEQVAARLNTEGIAVRAGLHCAVSAHQAMGTRQSGTVRVCPSVFNEKKDVKKLLNIIFKIAKFA
jgi:cysteine desulfurase family protein